MKKSELRQFTHSHSLTLLKLSLGEKFSADLKELAAKGATDGSDGLSQTVPLAPGDASKRPRRSGGLSLMAPTDGSDALGALVQSHLLRLGRMAAAMAPPLPRQTPCTVTTQRFADSLTNPELAHLLCTGPGRSC